MKILIFNGGPHKGNTWKLTQVVKKYLQKFDNTLEFNEIHLSEIALPFCTGCSNCFRKGHKTCPHHNKMQPVIDMIEECDAVVFSVPCFQGWNCQEKCSRRIPKILDRQESGGVMSQPS